jgi:hypothetical protein
MSEHSHDSLGKVFDLVLKTVEGLGGTNPSMDLIAFRIHRAHAAGVTDPQRLYTIALTGEE